MSRYSDFEWLFSQWYRYKMGKGWDRSGGQRGTPQNPVTESSDGGGIIIFRGLLHHSICMLSWMINTLHTTATTTTATSPSRTSSQSPSSQLRSAPTMPSASSPSLSDLLTSLNQSLGSHDTSRSLRLLSQAKLSLLQHNALIPSQALSAQTFTTARSILEIGAIVSIRTQDPESFNRYYSQLQPFYDFPTSSPSTQRSKITGLYLLLLLSQGDYAGFHTVLEGLVELSGVDGRGKTIEDDPFIKYPVDLERSLMEGSYDKVWRSTKGDGVPSEEFALFSEVCHHISLPQRYDSKVL